MRPVYSWASYSRSFSGLPLSHFASFFSDTVTFSISAGFLGRLATSVSVSPSLRHNLPPFLPLLLTLSLSSPLCSSVGLLERERAALNHECPSAILMKGKLKKIRSWHWQDGGVGCRSRDVKDRGRKIDWEAGKEWGRPVVCLDPNFLFMLTFFFFFCSYIHIKQLLYSLSDWKLKGRRTRGNSRKQLLECRPG